MINKIDKMSEKMTIRFTYSSPVNLGNPENASLRPGNTQARTSDQFIGSMNHPTERIPSNSGKKLPGQFL